MRLRAAGVRLVALFSPEHGFRGAADPGAAIASSVDSATGLPIYSLYGRTSAPTAEMLAGIDVMLVDLQDVGARYYTWLFTTIEVMKAAARRGRRGDRARPARTRSAGWCRGTCSQPGFVTTVGQLEIPMRHGMTLGELARLARSDLGLAVNLARRAGRRLAPIDAARPDRACRSSRRAPTSGPSRACTTIPGPASSRAPTSRWAAGRTRRSSRSARPGSTRPRVLARLRAATLPGVEFQGVSFTPIEAGRRQVRRHPGQRHPARGDRPGDATIRRRPRSTSCRRCGRPTATGSAGSRPTSTGWPGPRRSARPSMPGPRRPTIVARLAVRSCERFLSQQPSRP